MKKYLIIGDKGTLGTEFKNLLKTEDVLAVDKETLDITDPSAIKEYFSKHKPSVVINCAAFTNVDGTEAYYELASNINGAAVKYLSNACNHIGAKLIHFSTGMVFEGKNESGYNEDATPHPINKYGLTKLEGEKNLQKFCENYYLIRTEWIYGHPASHIAKTSFIEMMINLGEFGKVKGVTNEIGKPTWARDLAKATIELINSDKPKGIYHLVNEGQASRFDWVKEIYAIKKMGVNVEPVSGADFPRPAKRGHYELLNNTKLPLLRPWQEALREYLNS